MTLSKDLTEDSILYYYIAGFLLDTCCCCGCIAHVQRQSCCNVLSVATKLRRLAHYVYFVDLRTRAPKSFQIASVLLAFSWSSFSRNQWMTDSIQLVRSSEQMLALRSISVYSCVSNAYWWYLITKWCKIIADAAEDDNTQVVTGHISVKYICPDQHNCASLIVRLSTCVGEISEWMASNRLPESDESWDNMARIHSSNCQLSCWSSGHSRSDDMLVQVDSWSGGDGGWQSDINCTCQPSLQLVFLSVTSTACHPSFSVDRHRSRSGPCAGS